MRDLTITIPGSSRVPIANRLARVVVDPGNLMPPARSAAARLVADLLDGDGTPPVTPSTAPRHSVSAADCNGDCISWRGSSDGAIVIGIVDHRGEHRGAVVVRPPDIRRLRDSLNTYLAEEATT